MASAAPLYHGACFCQAVEFEARGAPMFRSLCHCSICSRLSGGLAALVGFEDDALVITKGKESLVGFKSSPGMERFRCKVCGSPVYNQSLIPEMLFKDAPLMAFKRDEKGAIINLDDLSPTSHMFYANACSSLRAAFDGDGLPKFEAYPQ